MLSQFILPSTLAAALLCGASAFGQLVPSGSNPPTCDDILEMAEHRFNFASPDPAGASPLEPSTTCRETLWKHVYDRSRLTVQEKCVTVTGTLVGAMPGTDAARHEPGGDTVGWLKLDPGQEKFLNTGNRQAQGGNLVFEIICGTPRKEGDASKACMGFNHGVKLPPAGSHVAITGSWVKNSEGEWFEILPVTSIVVRK